MKLNLLVLPVALLLYGSGNNGARQSPFADSPSSTETNFGKRTIGMPAGWKQPDAALAIDAVPGLRFEPPASTVRPGDRVQLTFRNLDSQPHNLLLVRPGAGAIMAGLAQDLGMMGSEGDFIPESLEVLYHTRLLAPGEAETIYFRAPLTPGVYPLVCSVPAHDPDSVRSVLNIQ